MSGRIHVFIGAPAIPQCPPQSLHRPPERRHEGDDRAHFKEGLCVTLEISPGNTPAGHGVCGDQSRGRPDTLCPIGCLGSSPLGDRESPALGGLGSPVLDNRGSSALGGLGSPTIGGLESSTQGGPGSPAIGGLESSTLGGPGSPALGGLRSPAIGGLESSTLGGPGSPAIGGLESSTLGGPGSPALCGPQEDISMISPAVDPPGGPSTHRSAASLHCDFLDLSVHEKDQDCETSATPTGMEFLEVLASTQDVLRGHCSSETSESNVREPEEFTTLNADPKENIICKRKTTTTSYSPSSSDRKSKKPKPSRECDHRRTQTTLLQHCSDTTSSYNILAVVIQLCGVKQIQPKSGPNSGSSFPLATIIVVDQSGVRRKVLMWRTAAFWSLALFPGDVVMLTCLTVCEDKWNKESFLQSTFRSRLLNLGNCFTLNVDETTNVDCLTLQDLLRYMATHHGYFREVPSRPPQNLDCIQSVRLSQLQAESLVHSILKVGGISRLRECTYHFRGLQQSKVILTVEDPEGQLGTLILWGASASWYEQIRMKRDHVWVFQYLVCKRSPVSGDVELHTTPWSSCECLFHDDKRAEDFHKRTDGTTSPPRLVSLRTVIDSKYSGDIQVNARITELEVHVPDHQSLCVTKQTSISSIMRSLPLFIYSGCGECGKELQIDGNHVYEQCVTCLPYNQVRLFYRPAVITVRSEDDQIHVHVNSGVLEKIFLNIPPKLLHKHAPGSSHVTYRAVMADICRSLVADNGESYLLTIKSHFSLDENSVALTQDFHLLGFHVTN